MFARRKHITLWLLLTLVALRGLVPAGYMVDASANGLAIVLCDSGIYAAAAKMSSAPSVGQHHHHHDHHPDMGPDAATPESGSSDHSICPFAMAATGSSADFFPSFELPAQAVLGRVESQPLIDFVSFGPSRAQQSRAPPALS